MHSTFESLAKMTLFSADGVLFCKTSTTGAQRVAIVGNAYELVPGIFSAKGKTSVTVLGRLKKTAARREPKQEPKQEPQRPKTEPKPERQKKAEARHEAEARPKREKKPENKPEGKKPPQKQK